MLKLLLLFILLFNFSINAQEFRFLRPVPDNVQTNGSYLYGEPSVHGGTSAHNGTDILVRWDTVYSASDGVVSFVGYSDSDTGQYGGYEPNGGGNYIIIRTLWNNSYYYLLYMHLTKPFTFIGQNIIAGQPIALSGNTGYSTGAHLHFEIRKGSQSSSTGNKRNAELWCGIKGMGTIYGNVPNAPNSSEVRITPDPKPRPPYTTYSYSLTYQFADPYIGSDDVYKENYAIGDVKPGTYTITALNGAYRRIVTVGAGQVVNADATTDIDGINLPVNDFILSQNYPNPFNPSTVINLQIPQRSFVQLKIYDLLGKEVAVLVDEERNEGSYNEIFNAFNLPSGFYIYSLIAHPYNGTKEFRQSKKMMLIK